MRLRTTECVSKGHPDKISDQISDKLLDEMLMRDPDSRVAIETMVKDNLVILGGEVKTNASLEYEEIVKKVVKDIGYDDPSHGFYYQHLTVLNFIGLQSKEINKAVENDSLGAGDQGFMVGYATSETSTFMPVGCYASRKLVLMVENMEALGPDIKTQVTINEDDNSFQSILISSMHSKDYSLEKMKEDLTAAIYANAMNWDKNIYEMLRESTKININPAGPWHTGGPVSDCGLTGRKIVVDQYGPYCPIGGGAFSGKDGSKVDRSGAYLARYLAKNIVASGIAKECRVEISYVIGNPNPSSVFIDTYSAVKNEQALSDFVLKEIPLTPSDIISKFKLTTPLFYQTAYEGHFGNNDYPWEKTDISNLIKENALYNG